MLTEARDYETLVRAFRWRVPERYNIGVDVCDRWAAAQPGRVAILEVDAAGAVTPWTYADLRAASNRLANALVARGIGPGDRVAILLPQSAAVAVAHVALYKIGAIALPLALLFGVDALGYRLADAGAKGLIATGAGIGAVFLSYVVSGVINYKPTPTYIPTYREQIDGYLLANQPLVTRHQIITYNQSIIRSGGIVIMNRSMSLSSKWRGCPWSPAGMSSRRWRKRGTSSTGRRGAT